ncbi:hypothetical protein PSTEL_11985 [Paenibacillus stellifer]|uniref:Nucleotidyltransferase n=1 Tax=Paenibacillus stellifer TaxID=169760 RepID=A0A089N4K9_9BACL|nr:nucleotidyltransferase family protein [Paenibacillus stellifer]AIQ63694.1 hypothetical protein PSTEL_11985 [Paenibacillus stellifer]
MKTEYGLILEMCRDRTDIEVQLDKDELRKLDWADALWFMSLNKIDCMFARKTINGMSWSEINKIVARDLRCKYLATHYRNSLVYRRIIPEIVQIFESLSVDFAMSKGVVHASRLYGSIGERYFGDIDLMVRKKDLKRIKEAFVLAGYTSGEYSFSKGVILEATPEAVKFYEMTTHQTFPFSKVFDDPVTDFIEIDLNFGLGPDRNMKDAGLTDRLLARRTMIQCGDAAFPGLSREDLVLHCCLEIFRDTTAVFHIKDQDDLKLYQFVELSRMIANWAGELDWPYMTSTATEFGLDKPVYYALYYCGQVFPDIGPLTEEFLRSIEPEDKSYLNQYGAENKQGAEWEMPFIERIFNKDRYELIRQTVETGDFGAFKKREDFASKNFQPK